MTPELAGPVNQSSDNRAWIEARLLEVQAGGPTGTNRERSIGAAEARQRRGRAEPHPG